MPRAVEEITTAGLAALTRPAWRRPGLCDMRNMIRLGGDAIEPRRGSPETPESYVAQKMRPLGLGRRARCRDG